MSSADSKPSGSGNRRRGGGKRSSRGGRDNRRGGAGRGGRRQERPNEAKLDDQMVDYWAKSDDPKLKERAEKERKERQELLNKQRQEKLDEDMKAYWKKQKVDEDAGAPKSSAEKET